MRGYVTCRKCGYTTEVSLRKKSARVYCPECKRTFLAKANQMETEKGKLDFDEYQ